MRIHISPDVPKCFLFKNHWIMVYLYNLNGTEPLLMLFITPVSKFDEISALNRPRLITGGQGVPQHLGVT